MAHMMTSNQGVPQIARVGPLLRWRVTVGGGDLDLSTDEARNLAADILNLLGDHPVVTVNVRGGVAYPDSLPPGVTLRIRDYDDCYSGAQDKDEDGVPCNVSEYTATQRGEE